jgi:hypothetical protein
MTGDNRIGSRSASPFLGSLAKGINATGSHRTGPAAETKFPETALRLLFFQAIPDGFDILISSQLQDLPARRINTFRFYIVTYFHDVSPLF